MFVGHCRRFLCSHQSTHDLCSSFASDAPRAGTSSEFAASIMSSPPQSLAIDFKPLAHAAQSVLDNPKRVQYAAGYKNAVLLQFANQPEADQRQWLTVNYPNLDLRLVRRWQAEEEERGPVPKGRTRRQGGGCKTALDQSQKEQLYQAVMKLRGEEVLVTTEWIRQEAQRMFPDVQCKWSAEWCRAWMIEFDLSVHYSFHLVKAAASERGLSLDELRRRHCENGISSLATFYSSVRRRHLEHSPHRVVVGDEIRLAFESHENMGCVDKIGAKSVRVRSDSKELQACTVFDSFTLSGEKLAPVIIFGGAKPDGFRVCAVMLLSPGFPH
jgi:hypothetical protein